MQQVISVLRVHTELNFLQISHFPFHGLAELDRSCQITTTTRFTVFNKLSYLIYKNVQANWK